MNKRNQDWEYFLGQRGVGQSRLRLDGVRRVMDQRIATVSAFGTALLLIAPPVIAWLVAADMVRMIAAAMVVALGGGK